MNSGYHSGTFSVLIVILFFLLIFGLAAPLMISPPAKKAKSASPAAALSETEDSGLFSRVGYIVETAEGRAVLYEEPGRPAIRKGLVFDLNSLCDLGATDLSCSPSSLPSGLRVKVSGFPTGESAIFVSKIERISP